jgi:hypothetical protein
MTRVDEVDGFDEVDGVDGVDGVGTFRDGTAAVSC